MNIFQNVKNPNVPRNTFDLSHDVKFTAEFGQLIPSLLVETYPGDNWNIKTQILARTLAMISPVMHLVEVDAHFYHCPIRVVFPGFDDIIAPPDDTPPLAPVWYGIQNVDTGDLGDYLGLPVDTHDSAANYEVVCYPVAAYSKIYDYWYRDQNLQAETFMGLIQGANNDWCRIMAQAPPLRRAWSHDYFTSNLPFAQKGDVVTLPLLEGTGQLDVLLKGAGNTPNTVQLKDRSTHVLESSDPLVSASGDLYTGASESVIDPRGSLYVDINTAAQDIITVRTAFKVQEFLEMDARAGTRYKEVVYAHFNVKTKDGRLQEPEYIGGQKSTLKISEVLSTAQTIQHNSNTR